MRLEIKPNGRNDKTGKVKREEVQKRRVKMEKKKEIPLSPLVLLTFYVSLQLHRGN